jgi:NAD(P)-dependent dehydrogenase (short-subunit alcohol dehydrogenase family)
MSETVVITGASRGIGLATARAFARAGDHVHALCRNPDRADDLHSLAAETGNVTLHRMDVTDFASIDRAAAEIGDAAIDIVINNAGIVGNFEQQHIDSMDYDAWRHVLETMMLGPLRVTQALMANLERSTAPKIIFISSEWGSSVYDSKGLYLYAYASAKGGLNRVAQLMAAELRERGIIVVPIRTDMAGPIADISPEESGGGIHSLAKGLTMADSGKFYRWNGTIHPW